MLIKIALNINCLTFSLSYVQSCALLLYKPFDKYFIYIYILFYNYKNMKLNTNNYF